MATRHRTCAGASGTAAPPVPDGCNGLLAAVGRSRRHHTETNYGAPACRRATTTQVNTEPLLSRRILVDFKWRMAVLIMAALAATRNSLCWKLRRNFC